MASPTRKLFTLTYFLLAEFRCFTARTNKRTLVIYTHALFMARFVNLLPFGKSRGFRKSQRPRSHKYNAINAIDSSQGSEKNRRVIEEGKERICMIHYSVASEAWTFFDNKTSKNSNSYKNSALADYRPFVSFEVETLHRRSPLLVFHSLNVGKWKNLVLHKVLAPDSLEGNTSLEKRSSSSDCLVSKGKSLRR